MTKKANSHGPSPEAAWLRQERWYEYVDLMRSALRVVAFLLVAGPQQPSWGQSATPPRTSLEVQNTMAQRMQACVVCHGKEGRATNQGYFPRLAGKPAGYLYNQLQHFRSGLRKFEPMNHLVRHMSDEYLQEISTYFADLDLPYPPSKVSKLTPAEQQTAEMLALQGVPERNLPACVACHGRQMAGMLPAVPGLLTLPADYLVAQLGAWRTGQRAAKHPDCMAEIAKRLSPEEVSVMARWLSAQTLPSGTKPAPSTEKALPLRCGSGEQ